jgi:hypothetical protein
MKLDLGGLLLMLSLVQAGLCRREANFTRDPFEESLLVLPNFRQWELDSVTRKGFCHLAYACLSQPDSFEKNDS